MSMKKIIKITLFSVIITILIIIGITKSNILNEDIYGDAHIEQPDGSILKLNDINSSGPHNATYIIDNESVTLVNGLSETEILPGSASKIVTKYFGNDVSVDLDGDAREDSVFLLTQETGGTGTLFYVVAALNTKDGWKGSQALFLGDRIAPQTTEISRGPKRNDVIVINYMDRKFDDAMTAQPSVGKSIWLQLDVQNMSFTEVEQNFEGESDPEVMTLDMKPWQWIKTVYNNDTEVKPNNPESFNIEFKNDNSFSATTDCNSLSGSYEVNDKKITFGENIAMTMMFCEESQEQEFVSFLGETQSFFFTNKGDLVFDLKFDSGSVIFK